MRIQIAFSIFGGLIGGCLCMVVGQRPEVIAQLTKQLLKAISKPGRLTAMTCWTSDFSLKFYETFHMPFENNELDDYELSIGSISRYNLPHSNQSHYEFIMIDRNCDYSMDILKFTGRGIDDYSWIIWSSQSNETLRNGINDDLLVLPISPRSEIFYSNIENGDTESEQMNVLQIYRIGFETPLLIEPFGTFGIKNFIDSRSSSITSRRRINLSGYKFKASMVITNNDTLNHLTDYRETQTDPLTKVNYILTEFLMNYLNATINYTTVTSWGYRDEKTGDWSGMVGQLVRNEVELGATPLFMTVDRVLIIQYIASPTPTGSRFIFRSPKLSYTENVYILPFDEFVWYCLLLLIFVTALFLTISILIEWRCFLPKYGMLSDESSLLHPKIGDVFLLVFGATCQQGSSVTPRSATARLIMIITSTILMFLYTSYSANIVALLQSPSTKIKTLKDLYESRLQIGVDDTVFNRYYFAHAEEPIRKKIYLNKVLRPNGQDNFMNLEEGVRRVRQGLFAFHMELSIGYKLMGETFFEDEKCGIVEIPYLQVTDPWYAIRKNSSFTEMFKIGMMRMREHGMEGRENKRMYSKKPQCVGHAGNFITASLVDTKPALLILLWGYIIAGGLLFFEWICHNFLKKMKGKIIMNE